jgi:hypothetical protein
MKLFSCHCCLSRDPDLAGDFEPSSGLVVRREKNGFLIPGLYQDKRADLNQVLPFGQQSDSLQSVQKSFLIDSDFHAILLTFLALLFELFFEIDKIGGKRRI